MADTIKVLDYIMGSGKSTFILDYMTRNQNERYMYITPLLSEAEERALDAAASIDIKVPSTDEGNKSDSLLELLEEGANISTTHSLFRRLKNEHIELIEQKGYILIVDEVVDFIEAFCDYSPADIKDLFARGDLTADADNLGVVSMNWNVTNGAHFSKLKHMCDAGMVYSDKAGDMLTCHIPPRMIKAAKDVIVCTFMYNSSLMSKFMQMHGFQHKYITTPSLDNRQKAIKESIPRNLKMQEMHLGRFFRSDLTNALSHGWYSKQLKLPSSSEANKAAVLFKKISNWLTNNEDIDRNNFFLTCPKQVVESTSRKKSLVDKLELKYLNNMLQGEDEGDSKWLFSGTKATNDYKDRTLCIHALNIFPNVPVQRYLVDYAEPVDLDEYALSEMLQFIWRGCIREGKPMDVLVIPPRMKAILEGFLVKHT